MICSGFGRMEKAEGVFTATENSPTPTSPNPVPSRFIQQPSYRRKRMLEELVACMPKVYQGGVHPFEGYRAVVAALGEHGVAAVMREPDGDRHRCLGERGADGGRGRTAVAGRACLRGHSESSRVSERWGRPDAAIAASAALNAAEPAVWPWNLIRRDSATFRPIGRRPAIRRATSRRFTASWAARARYLSASYHMWTCAYMAKRWVRIARRTARGTSRSSGFPMARVCAMPKSGGDPGSAGRSALTQTRCA